MRRARAASPARSCCRWPAPADSDESAPRASVAAAAAAAGAEAADRRFARLEHVLLGADVGAGVELHARLREQLALPRLDRGATRGEDENEHDQSHTDVSVVAYSR